MVENVRENIAENLDLVGYSNFIRGSKEAPVRTCFCVNF